MIDAARRGAADECRCLLALGGDVRATNDVGWTVLHAAARAGHAPLVRLLAAAGAEVDALSANRRTPLHWAVCNGHEAAAQALLEAGADRNSRNKYGATPLSEAYRVNEGPVAHKLAALLRAFNRMRVAPPPTRSKAAPGDAARAPDGAADGA
jgi:ankyrin repeat protein